MQIAIAQTTTGIDPAANARVLVEAMEAAAASGAAMLFTPEMCGLLDGNRSRAAMKIHAARRTIRSSPPCATRRRVWDYGFTLARWRCGVWTAGWTTAAS